jgi:hypothetical protein
VKREEAKEERLGRLEGQCSVPDDFDAMHAEELADLFSGWPTAPGSDPD